MNESELRAQFEALRPALDAWGDFVVNTIKTKLGAELARHDDKRKIDEFLKIPAKYRVKEVASFLAKALHRAKGYKDPLAQITDMVGVRFVVLLSSETSILDEVVEDAHEWDSTKDRDFERARADRPHFFDYESNHYVVKNARPRTHKGISIPANVACEVQIRTLLQHAYAELSHDRLYKPECKVPDEVRRLVARGSALLETTDHVFCQVSDGIADALRSLQDIHNAAIKVSENAAIILSSRDSQLSFNLLEQFGAYLPEISAESLAALIKQRSYIPQKMAEHTQVSLLFSHPAGLVSYWLIDRLQRDALDHWPFDSSLARLIASDMGISLGD